MATPVGGGIRSLNVALRQDLDLYACVRPCVGSKVFLRPVKEPSQNGYDHLPREHGRHLCRYRIQMGTDDNKKFIAYFKEAFPKMYKKIRFPETSGIGIKPVSK